MKVLLFYGTHTLFLAFIRSLRDVPGLKVAGLFREGDSQTARLSRHLAKRYEVPSGLGEEIELRALEDAVGDFCPEVVLAVCDRAHELLSRHRDRLAKLPCSFVPTVPWETLIEARDKRLLSLFLRRHGLPHPTTCQLPEFVSAAPASLPAGPWLLKPANLNGGKGIIRFETTAETLAHLVEKRPDPGEHVVQQWIDGDLVDCSVLCREGRILAHTTYRSLETAKGFAPQHEIEFADLADVLAVTADLMATLGWNGLANLDLIRERKTGRLLVLELNARSWSSLLGSTAAGVNFPWLACHLARGHAVPPSVMRPLRFKLRLDAARQLAKACLRFQKPKFAFRETDLPYVVRDPGPELFGLLRELGRRFAANR